MHLQLFAIVMSFFCEVIRMGSGVMQKQSAHRETSEDCQSCLECSWDNGCVRCPERFFLFLQRKGMSHHGTCLHSCPAGHYGQRGRDVNRCMKCRSLDCEQCFSRDFCTKCKPGFKLYKGKCLIHCPEGAFAHQTDCLEDCSLALMGEWSEWSFCLRDGATCGFRWGKQTRVRETSQGGTKLAVRSCPVGTTKPLSLIKPPSQGIAISVVPAKAPVSMVTAHINGQKAPGPEPLQTSPINLQASGRAPAGAGVVPFGGGRRAGELLPPSQMLGTLTAVPIKVPQVSSLHRLAGQAATVLPQVRPKTQIPDSLPHSPCQELQPLSLQRVTAVVSPKSQAPTLPTANSTFSSEHQPNSQNNASTPLLAPSLGPDLGSPSQHASAGPGVAYAIIAASPAPGNGVSAVSEAVKVIIIQPQAPSSIEGSPGAQADFPLQEAPTAKSPPKRKKEEDPEKIAFMVALGLVTTEQLEEIQTKRQERKRRSTANPAYSGLLEPERKRLPSHYLNSSLYLSAREDFCWKEELEHDDRCAVCKEEGELQPCHNCPRAYHPSCLHPPIKSPHRGPWYCPKCQKKVLNKENLSWPQNFVQSYVTHKTVRQEEKRRLLTRNNELKKECSHLEEQDQKLNKTLKACMDQRDRLLGLQRDTQASLDRLKTLIRLIQRDQLVQVTMTTVAKLPQLWMKPTSTPSAALLQPSPDDVTN